MNEKTTLMAGHHPITIEREQVQGAPIGSITVGPVDPEANTMAPRFPSTSDQRTANNTTRQAYRQLSPQEKELVDRVKTLGAQFIELLHEIGGTDPAREQFASRNLSLANTHAEDAVMRAVRHITQ